MSRMLCAHERWTCLHKEGGSWNSVVGSIPLPLSDSDLICCFSIFYFLPFVVVFLVCGQIETSRLEVPHPVLWRLLIAMFL
jgi:hypothetical protein